MNMEISVEFDANFALIPLKDTPRAYELTPCKWIGQVYCRQTVVVMCLVIPQLLGKSNLSAVQKTGMQLVCGNPYELSPEFHGHEAPRNGKQIKAV
jgi:hypothetical protein